MMKSKLILKEELFDEAVGGKNCPIWLKDKFIADGAIDAKYMSQEKKDDIAMRGGRSIWRIKDGDQKGNVTVEGTNMTKALNNYVTNVAKKPPLDFNNLKIYKDKEFPTSWNDKIFSAPYIPFFYFKFKDADGSEDSQVWIPGINNTEQFRLPGWWTNNSTIMKNHSFRTTMLPEDQAVGMIPQKSDHGKKSKVALDYLKKYATDWCYLSLEDDQNFKLSDNFDISNKRKQWLYDRNLTIDNQGRLWDKETCEPVFDANGNQVQLRTRVFKNDELKNLDNYFRLPTDKQYYIDAEGNTQEVTGHTAPDARSERGNRDRFKGVMNSNLFNKIISEHPELQDDMFDRSGYLKDPDWYLSRDTFKKLQSSNIYKPLAQADARMTVIFEELKDLRKKISRNNRQRWQELLDVDMQATVIRAYWEKLLAQINTLDRYYDKDYRIEAGINMLDKDEYNLKELQAMLDETEAAVKDLKPGKFNKDKVMKMKRPIIKGDDAYTMDHWLKDPEGKELENSEEDAEEDEGEEN